MTDQPKFAQGDLVHVTNPSAPQWHDKNVRVACQLSSGKYRLRQLNPHSRPGGLESNVHMYGDFPECDLHLVIPSNKVQEAADNLGVAEDFFEGRRSRRNEDIVRGFENSSPGTGIRIKESRVQQENSRLKLELLEAEEKVGDICRLLERRAHLKAELKQIERDIKQWWELNS